MKVVTIILNYNNWKNTAECLQSLQKVKTIGFELEIITVDNASMGDDVVLLKKKFPKLLLVENKTNLGFAAGNNMGIKLALSRGADFVLLLNNDTVVDEGFLVNLLTIFKKDHRISIVSPKIYFYPGCEYHHERYKKSELGKVIWYAGGLFDWHNMLPSHYGVDEVDTGQYQLVKETDFATGCCMLIKREVLEKIGLFDEKYFLYWEDIDLCERAKTEGFIVMFAPKAYIWHKNASSSGGAGGNISVYYQTRNRALFTAKHANLRSKIAVIRELASYLLWGDTWQKKAAQDFFTLKFGKLRD